MTDSSSANGTYVLRKKAPVSNRNKDNITNDAINDNTEPRLVPSNKSVGTFRYISNRPIHRKLPDMVVVCKKIALPEM
jgi:hypothetical protein